MTGVAEIIVAELAVLPAEPIIRCAEELRRHFGPKTAAVLFYGGALRELRPDSLLDFYVLTDDLSILPRPLERLGAWLLPPNVYFMTPTAGGSVQRCKVAVMTTRAFARGMSTFEPHLWARFSQAVSAPYLRDASTRDCVVAALATAVETMITRVISLMPHHVTPQDLWTRAFMETYAAELRPEGCSRAADLARAPRFAPLTAAMRETVDNQPEPACAALAWSVRRGWGKLLNALRLIKAAFTYDGGLDYAVAKIARHTGVQIRVRETDRRIQLLGGIRIFVEAWRRGGVR